MPMIADPLVPVPSTFVLTSLFLVAAKYAPAPLTTILSNSEGVRIGAVFSQLDRRGGQRPTTLW